MAKKKGNVIVSFILDKSGSMEVVRDSTISGVNEYVQTLKKDKENKYKFTLTLFDTNVTKKYENEDLANVKDLDRDSYNPSNGTALYDAVCKTIKDLESEVGKDDKVLVVILTDGEENSSKEYTQAHMKVKIEELQKSNWTFVFLGANQDAWANAQKMGFQQSNVSNFNGTDRGVTKAFASVAMNTVAYASMNMNSTNLFFSDKDKKSLESTR